MNVCCTGDFHGRTPPDIPDCDLVLFAGDLGLHESNMQMYIRWLTELMERRIPVVGIAGNHDFNSDFFAKLPWMYLENNMTTIAGKGTDYLRVFGSPLSPPFNNWAHMRPETELEKVYAQIPDDIDVIVSHGPPHGYGDYVPRDGGLRVGSEALTRRIAELPNLKLVACGHIHEGYGMSQITYPVQEDDHLRRVPVVNGSWVNVRYEPGNPPILVEL